MRSFLKAESFYIIKDTGFKTISFMLLAASVVLVLWMRSAGGERYITNFLEPLGSIMALSIFLYLIIPLYACFFSTEGFESGTIKNIIASGTSRSAYFWGKFWSAIKVILWSLVQFYAVFLLFFYLIALLSRTEIGNTGLAGQAALILSVVLYNILYLMAYMAVVLMVGFIVRKTSITAILTFAFIFGNLFISGYWKDSAVPLLQTISEYSLMTQIFKFSGIYVKNSENILLSGAADHIIAVAIPAAIIVICLSVALIVFHKRDIQTN